MKDAALVLFSAVALSGFVIVLLGLRTPSDIGGKSRALPAAAGPKALLAREADDVESALKEAAAREAAGDKDSARAKYLEALDRAKNPTWIKLQLARLDMEKAVGAEDASAHHLGLSILPGPRPGDVLFFVRNDGAVPLQIFRAPQKTEIQLADGSWSSVEIVHAAGGWVRLAGGEGWSWTGTLPRHAPADGPWETRLSLPVARDGSPSQVVELTTRSGDREDNDRRPGSADRRTLDTEGNP